MSVRTSRTCRSRSNGRLVFVCVCARVRACWRNVYQEVRDSYSGNVPILSINNKTIAYLIVHIVIYELPGRKPGQHETHWSNSIQLPSAFKIQTKHIGWRLQAERRTQIWKVNDIKYTLIAKPGADPGIVNQNYKHAWFQTYNVINGTVQCNLITSNIIQTLSFSLLM